MHTIYKDRPVFLEMDSDGGWGIEVPVGTKQMTDRTRVIERDGVEGFIEARISITDRHPESPLAMLQVDVWAVIEIEGVKITAFDSGSPDSYDDPDTCVNNAIDAACAAVVAISSYMKYLSKQNEEVE